MVSSSLLGVSTYLVALLIAPVQAGQYATILYYTWSNFVLDYGQASCDVDLAYAAATGCTDVKLMGSLPYGSGYNYWGTPAFVPQQQAAGLGDGTIKNTYVLYYGDATNPNRALIDYHADLLVAAGIDFITIDFSNGAIAGITEGALALMNRFVERSNLGLQSPQVAFLVYDYATLEVVQSTFHQVYPSQFFFFYLGKMLAMIAPYQYPPNQAAILTDGICSQYTCRTMWALNPDGSQWSLALPVPNGTPFMFNGEPEQVSAAVACQSTYMTGDGISAYGGAQGRDNGDFFSSNMDWATSSGAKFVFIYSWNDWSILNQAPSDTFPGSNAVFVDGWEELYTADIEPMAGGHGTFYYDLMVQKIAEFKGKPVVAPTFTFLGAYGDQPNRALAFVNGGSQTYNVASCFAYAVANNFQYFALQNCNCNNCQCGVSNNLQQAQEYGLTSSYSTCASDGYVYGGPYGNALYQVGGSGCAAAIPPGSDCTSSPDCCPSDYPICSQKDQFFASCYAVDTCTPGIHSDDPVAYQTPWTCNVLGVSSYENLAANTNTAATSLNAIANGTGVPIIIAASVAVVAVMALVGFFAARRIRAAKSKPNRV